MAHIPRVEGSVDWSMRSSSSKISPDSFLKNNISIREDEWLSRLEIFVAQNGRIPKQSAGAGEEEASLAGWLERINREHDLSPKAIRKFEEIGLIVDGQFFKKERLQALRDKIDECLIFIDNNHRLPRKDSQNDSELRLYRFIMRLRNKFNKQKLDGKFTNDVSIAIRMGLFKKMDSLISGS
ncbi:MAG: hypothetical protein WA057_04605 [Candidatus Magasanikiibacteriota bacterium]